MVLITMQKYNTMLLLIIRYYISTQFIASFNKKEKKMQSGFTVLIFGNLLR